jgi:hypothetical protein
MMIRENRGKDRLLKRKVRVKKVEGRSKGDRLQKDTKDKDRTAWRNAKTSK